MHDQRSSNSISLSSAVRIASTLRYKHYGAVSITLKNLAAGTRITVSADGNKPSPKVGAEYMQQIHDLFQEHVAPAWENFDAALCDKEGE